MARYLLKRVLYMIPVLLAVSVLSFVIIQLPPGDFLTSKIAQLEMLGEEGNLHGTPTTDLSGSNQRTTGAGTSGSSTSCRHFACAATS